jgi:hypothetical protein
MVWGTQMIRFPMLLHPKQAIFSFRFPQNLSRNPHQPLLLTLCQPSDRFVDAAENVVVFSISFWFVELFCFVVLFLPRSPSNFKQENNTKVELRFITRIEEKRFEEARY